ncbi:uncharacterized protein [Diadema setosum]|uniref:uncharacterized protein n=1 Tax=Diadema setosum TaxID=31175 RepID=UPI003B3B72F3
MDLIGFTHVVLAVLVYCWQWRVSHQAICSDSPTPPTCLDDCSGRHFYLGQDGLCKMCVQCLEGMGLDKYCGDGENGDAKCVPCQEGHYSDSSMYYDCLPCRICENTEIAQECTPTTDRECGACHTGYYRDPQNPDLCNQKCEWLHDPKSEPQCSVWWASQHTTTQHPGQHTTSNTSISILPGDGSKSRSMILIAVVVVMLVLVIVGILIAVFMLRSELGKRNTRQNHEGSASSSPTGEGQEQEMDRLLPHQEQNEASRVENKLRQNGSIMTSRRGDDTPSDDDSTEDAHDRWAEGTSLKGGAHYDDETDGPLVATRCISTHRKTGERAVRAPATLREQTKEAGDMGREKMQADMRVENGVVSGGGEIEWKKDKDFPAGDPFHGEQDMEEGEEEKGEEEKGEEEKKDEGEEEREGENEEKDEEEEEMEKEEEQEEEENDRKDEKEEKQEKEEKKEEKGEEEEKREEDQKEEKEEDRNEENDAKDEKDEEEEGKEVAREHLKPPKVNGTCTCSSKGREGTNSSMNSEMLNQLLSNATIHFNTLVLGDQHNHHELPRADRTLDSE